jgi:hypothetical protein
MTRTVRYLLIFSWIAYALLLTSVYIDTRTHIPWLTGESVLVVMGFGTLIAALSVATLGLSILGLVQMRSNAKKVFDVALVAFSLVGGAVQFAYVTSFFGPR